MGEVHQNNQKLRQLLKPKLMNKQQFSRKLSHNNNQDKRQVPRQSLILTRVHLLLFLKKVKLLISNHNRSTLLLQVNPQVFKEMIVTMVCKVMLDQVPSQNKANYNRQHQLNRSQQQN